MFSRQVIVIDIDAAELAQGPSRLAELLKKLSALPANAREQRSAYTLSFEAAGIPSLVRDAGAMSYVNKLAEAAPWVGYFINGNPPFFHLREFSLAVSNFRPEGQTIKGFLAAHQALYQAAVEHCDTVDDLPSALEEVFVVNLLHEVLTADPTLQARAMRAIYPLFGQTESASPVLRRLVFTEAERIWGRSVDQFLSADAFVRDFQRHFSQQLARV